MEQLCLSLWRFWREWRRGTSGKCQQAEQIGAKKRVLHTSQHKCSIYLRKTCLKVDMSGWGSLFIYLITINHS
ncbi:MAG: hypothetical protein ABF628_09405, partial [Acetobacter orientalis]|uniref:hypothetical protein n=1 Tax=Acetobacter orientalis TaxID=146474 RepID=UPI0039EB5AC9